MTTWRDPKLARGIGPALVACAFVVMLAWTWGGWPDPIVDFGRELYVPWQLSQGKVLYRDIAYFNGPFSPYFNALLFRILGVSLRTLVLANIAIAGAVVVMIWRLLRLAGDRLSATVACLLFITLFMTTQYVTIGNYNWITPYSHELTHGIALSLFAMLMFVRYLRRPTPARASGVGLLVGLIFLTKPEVFLAIATPICIAILITRGRSLQSLIAFVIGSCTPALLSSAMLGWRGTLGGWMYAFDARITSLTFYRISMGMDRPGPNLALGAIQGGASVLMFMLFASFDRALIARRTSRRVHWATAIIAMLVVVLVLIWSRNRIGWHDAFRGLPIALVLWSIAILVGLRRRYHGRLSLRLVLRMLLVSFALLLTLKLILAVRLYHYGFALTMPAMLVASAMFLSWLPSTLRIRHAIVTRCCMVGVLGFIVGLYLSVYANFYSRKPATVALGTADEFRADVTGLLVNDVVDVLKPLPPQTTVAVVPQGVMVNYLSGKANPTPYFTLMPPEVLMFGDDKIAAAYEKNPPDVLVIIAADLSEYGVRSFDEIAPRTSSFFKANYQPIRVINARAINPSSRDLPPVTILRRVRTDPQ